MQMLDVKPIKLEALGLLSPPSCYNDTLATASNWFQRRYELSFVQSLHMQYDAGGASQSIGSRLNVDHGDSLELLEFYHGVSFFPEHEHDYEQGKAMILEQLRLHKPMVLAVDSYYLPWDPKYRSTHFYNHVFLVKGADENGIYCIDPFFNVKDDFIPFHDLQQGYIQCIRIETTRPEMTDLTELASYLQDQFLNKSNYIQRYEDMMRLADDLRAIDFEREGAGELGVGQSPIYLKITELAVGRSNFTLLVSYLDERYALIHLDTVLEQMKKVSLYWGGVRVALAKMFYADGEAQSMMMEHIVEKIKEAATLEKEAIAHLLQALELKERRAAGSASSFAAILQDRPVTHPARYQCLDLELHMNNKAFGSEQALANFDSSGFCYSNELMPNAELQVLGVPLKLLNVLEAEPDNIACFGQSIDVPEGRYAAVLVAGAAHNGNFIEKLTVEYTNGSAEHLDFGFADWYNHIPVNREVIAWSSKCLCENPTTEHFYIPEAVHIYATTIAVDPSKPIRRLVLPVMQFLHVFAVTLLCADE